jgi:O-methyltransferase
MPMNLPALTVRILSDIGNSARHVLFVSTSSEHNLMDLIKSFANYIAGFLSWTVWALARHKFDRRLYRMHFPEVWYSPWDKNKEFSSLYKKIRNHTNVSKMKLFDLYAINKQIQNLEGDVLEIGTYRGGSAALLAAGSSRSRLFMWDIWGMKIKQNDYFIKKLYSTSEDLEFARELLKSMVTDFESRCEFINELFPNPDVIRSWDNTFAIVNFDTYDENAFSEGIELIWPKLCVGGIFVVGGYGAISLDPLTRAVNAFTEKNDCLFVQAQSGSGLI